MPTSTVGDNMKALSAIIITCLSFGSVLSGSETLDRARQLLKSGDAPAAKTLLARAARRNPKDVTTLSEYAEFLDQFGDPGARVAYAKLLDALGTGDAAKRTAVAKRLIALDMLAGDQAAARNHLEAYQAAGGKGLTATGSGS